MKSQYNDYIKSTMGNTMKVNNFVAKHIKRSGTGQHKAKFGKNISRARSKHLNTKGE